MLYVNKQIDTVTYRVYDTDDATNSYLSKDDILELSKQYKILGVSKSGIKPINPLKLFKRWLLLDTVKQNLGDISPETFFGKIDNIFSVSFFNNSLRLVKVESDCKNIKVPNYIDSIAYNTFEKCKCVESIEIPDSVIKLGTFCFTCLEFLKNIKLSNNITELPDYCFNRCKSLQSIELNSNIIIINERAFSDCFNLKNIKLQDGIKTIKQFAFAGCRSIESIVIPESVIYIGDDAFFNCCSLKEIVMPKSFESAIENNKLDCFTFCDNLKYIYVNNKKFDYANGVWC